MAPVSHMVNSYQRLQVIDRTPCTSYASYYLFGETTGETDKMRKAMRRGLCYGHRDHVEPLVNPIRVSRVCLFHGYQRQGE